jgi:hypothetical protein
MNPVPGCGLILKYATEIKEIVAADPDFAAKLGTQLHRRGISQRVAINDDHGAYRVPCLWLTISAVTRLKLWLDSHATITMELCQVQVVVNCFNDLNPYPRTPELAERY